MPAIVDGVTSIGKNQLEVWQNILETLEQVSGSDDFGFGPSRGMARQQATPNNTLRITGGAWWFGGTVVLKLAGPYTSPSFGNRAVTNPRIDLLSMTSAGVFVVTAGA